jgi:hypothetical protein
MRVRIGTLTVPVDALNAAAADLARSTTRPAGSA